MLFLPGYVRAGTELPIQSLAAKGRLGYLRSILGRVKTLPYAFYGSRAHCKSCNAPL